jgi:hypothetical protein
MASGSKRRVAILVLVLLAFAQGSVAFHVCAMDRADMSSAMAMAGEKAGEACEAPMTGKPAQNANLCVLHCTADLQTTGAAVALVDSPLHSPVLAVVRAREVSTPLTGLLAPPSGAPPHRILLHSFLI